MRQVKIISTLLCLNLFAACSTNTEYVPLLPPENLLERAEPLPKTPVVTTRDIVQRALAAEHEYNLLRVRHNSLIDWISKEPS